MHASFRIPTQTDLIADLQTFDIFTQRRDFPDNFVSANKRIFASSSIRCSTSKDLNDKFRNIEIYLNLFTSQFARIKFKRFKFSTGFHRRVCFLFFHS